MRIFIAGATGVLGRRLMRLFTAGGHEVLALARRPENEAIIAAHGGVVCRGDLFNARSMIESVRAADVVIHAATAVPTTAKPTPSEWGMNDQIRREGTAALLECAAAVGAKQFVLQSIVWVATPDDGSEFDEDSPRSSDPLMQSAIESEDLTREAAARDGFTPSILRCGWFYGADAKHTQQMREALLIRRLPILGAGDAIWRFLHLDDAASAFVAVAETRRGGLYHVVDDEGVPARDLLNRFARQIGAADPRTVPIWLAKLLAGNMSVKFLTQSVRTSNARFCRETGWRPQYPTYREGFDQVVSEWKRSHALETSAAS